MQVVKEIKNKIEVMVQNFAVRMFNNKNKNFAVDELST